MSLKMNSEIMLKTHEWLFWVDPSNAGPGDGSEEEEYKNKGSLQIHF